MGRLNESLVSVHEQLDTILTLERAGHRRIGELVMASAEIKAALAKIDAATDNIAADVQRLKERIAPGMTQAEVDEIQKEADRIATKLEGIAADNEDPVPGA